MRDSAVIVGLKEHSSAPGFLSANLQEVAISPLSLSDEGEARVAFQITSSGVSDRSLERLQRCLPADAARTSSLSGATPSLQ